jgi:hypothetical protein
VKAVAIWDTLTLSLPEMYRGAARHRKVKSGPAETW